jgi:RHS repeat-associated protein
MRWHGWRQSVALLLLVILINGLLPSNRSSAAVHEPAAIQAAPSATRTPLPSSLPTPSPRPIVTQVAPFRAIPRSLMAPQFASDALSHVDRLFGPQIYGWSFGDPIDTLSGAYHFTTTDLSVHARGLDFSFTRTYNSLDDSYEPDGSSFLGSGWRHSFWWEIPRAPVGGSGCGQTWVRGDGQRQQIVADGTNADFAACTFASGITTVTLRDQTRYVFGNRYDYEPGEYTVYSLYQLLRIELPTGDRVLLTYAGSPLVGGVPVLSTVTDTVGRVYQFTYDSTAHLTRVGDPSGRASTFGYDASGRLTSATDPMGATTHYGYDGTSRHIATYTDPDGRVRATNTFDLGGQVTQQVDGEGNVTTRSVSGQNAVNVTDPRGTTSVYLYCNCGSGLIQERTWVGTYGGPTYYDTFYGYDAYGNRNQITDRLGHVTNLVFDAHANANLLSSTDAVGAVTRYQYDSKNNLTQTTDPRGFVTQRTYDATTNVLISERVQIDASTYATTAYTYGDPANPGLPTAITSPSGSVTTLTYDAVGDLATRIDAEGNLTSYTYDALGRRTGVTDPDGHTTITAYDSNDRTTSVRDALGYFTRYAYDGAGNKVGVTDRNGNLVSYVYDRDALLSSVQEHASPTATYTTSLTHDGNGNVTRVTEGNGIVRDSTYDTFDRITAAIQYTSQGTLTTTYAGDALGHVLSRVTADNVTTNYGYDADYRLTSISAPGIAISYGYDLAGNRTTMTDATGTTTYTYDGAGRMTSAAAAGGTITYAYDLDGNRTTIGYPGAGNVSYTYTPAGRLSTVTDWAGRRTTYAYRPSGLVSSVAYPNGMLASYDYDNAGRLTSLTNDIGPTTLTSHGYTLDPEGNRITLAEFVSGITAPGTLDTSSYSYDGLNRLTGSTGAVTEGFTLDGASNLTSRTGPGATYTYDGADRVQSDGTLVFGWSKADQLTFHGQSTPPPPPPPAVAFRAQSTNNNGLQATSLTINQPAGTQPGDLLLAFIYSQNGVAAITPSGWTSVGGPTSNGGHMGQVFYHLATASDPASWSWTYGQYWSPDDNTWYPNMSCSVGSILAYSGVDPNSPLSPATASTNNGSTATIATNAITTGSANEMLVASYGQYAQYPGPTPSGWTNRVATGGGGWASGAIKVEEMALASAGYTNGLQWNSGNTWPWVAFLVGLKPAPPPPPPPPPPGDTFSYDPLDRLTGSTVSNVARTYAYNGDGLLQSRTQSGTTTTLLWDPASSPSRLIQVGSDRMVYGLGPLYAVKGDGSTVSFARDGGKSVRAEVSGGGAVSSSFRYGAYGTVNASTGASAPIYVGYAGQLQDPSGLLYMRSRWYDPAAGRFMTHDPSGADPTSGTPNPFGYAGGNPAIRVDPTGLAAADESSGGCETADGCAYQPAADGNWAYAIADVFRDLDSSDTGTRVAAYAKVTVTGLIAGGIGAAAWAGVCAVAGAAATTEAVTATTVFVGETASRVAAAAAAAGGIAYNAPNIPPGAARMEANMAWVDDVMSQGLRIVDIGRDPAKVQAGLAVGRYWMAELHRINAAAYEFYYPIIRR